MGFDMTHLLKNLELSVGIGEASRVSGATFTQIRYWEKKGLLKSFSYEDGRNKRFTLHNVVTMSAIKQMLDDGYTLTKAAEIIQKRQDNATMLQTFLHNRLSDISTSTDGSTNFNFGPIENDPGFDVVAQMSDNSSRVVKVPHRD